MSAITICSDFGAQKNKVWHCFHCFPIYLPWSDGIFIFWMLSFKPTFSLSSFTFIKRFFSSSLSAIRVESSAYLRLLLFLPGKTSSVSSSWVWGQWGEHLWNCHFLDLVDFTHLTSNEIKHRPRTLIPTGADGNKETLFGMKSESESCSVVSHSSRPYGLYGLFSRPEYWNG